MQALVAALMLALAASGCGDDSAPPGNPDGPVDAPAIDGAGGTGGTAGSGGSGGMAGDGSMPDAYAPRCTPQCFQTDSVCVDPDGPGGNMPFCGCGNDSFCQATGSCNRSDGRCYCGSHLPCVQGITICISGDCVPVDAGP